MRQKRPQGRVIKLLTYGRFVLKLGLGLWRGKLQVDLCCIKATNHRKVGRKPRCFSATGDKLSKKSKKSRKNSDKVFPWQKYHNRVKNGRKAADWRGFYCERRVGRVDWWSCDIAEGESVAELHTSYLFEAGGLNLGVVGDCDS